MLLPEVEKKPKWDAPGSRSPLVCCWDAIHVKRHNSWAMSVQLHGWTKRVLGRSSSMQIQQDCKSETRQVSPLDQGESRTRDGTLSSRSSTVRMTFLAGVDSSSRGEISSSLACSSSSVARPLPLSRAESGPMVSASSCSFAPGVLSRSAAASVVEDELPTAVAALAWAARAAASCGLSTPSSTAVVRV